MSTLRRRRARQPPAVPSGGSGHSPPGQAQSAWLACTSTRAVAWRLQATSATISSRIFDTGSATICSRLVKGYWTTRTRHRNKSVCLARFTRGAVHSATVRCTRRTCSVRLLTRKYEKNPHIKQNQCDCLPRFTRRAFSNPPLLALLPFDDDVLRERPQAACLVIGG